MYTKKFTRIRVGTALMHKEYGRGKCTKIDYQSKAFRYFFKFEDDTVAWLSDDDCAKVSQF